jgi:hypothetical protein
MEGLLLRHNDWLFEESVRVICGHHCLQRHCNEACLYGIVDPIYDEVETSSFARSEIGFAYARVLEPIRALGVGGFLRTVFSRKRACH